MNEAVTDRLLAFLREQGVEIAVLTHEPVRTSEEAARVRGTPLAWGAKALVCRADGAPVLLVVPADRRVDTRAFKRAFGVKDLRMISADELKTLTGLEAGAVPPFREILGLPTYVDSRLLDLDRIAFNAGSRSVSVVMPARDYARLAQAWAGLFASEPTSIDG
jgi:Ala-tRNA(Pro) deacylase